MAPLARRGRAGVGGRNTAHGLGVGLLQLRSLASSPLLRSSSARPSSPSHAHRGKAHQQTPRCAPQRRSMLTRPPPRVAAMEDEAEEETVVEIDGEHRRLRIREARALPSSRCAFQNTSFSSRGRCYMFVRGCHPCTSVFGDLLLVPVILFLTLLSRFLPKWWFCPPPDIHHCCCNTLAVPG